MGVFSFIRIAVLGVTTLFSIIVLAISAHLISQTQQYFGATATFSSLALAVAVISLVTLPVMLVVDFIRSGAFTSMIVVELAWLYTLCILWVAAAGETVTEYNLFFPFGCDFLDTIVNGMCQSTQVIEAFSFLNFIIMLLYASVLSVMAVVAATRGQGVWLSSVKESLGSRAVPAHFPMTQNNTQAQHTAQPGATLAAV
ncbi:hypothetical protein EV363DRAFT_1207402 [Boletus edulis]|uniref:MARVEL domain-containing protein n=1 Tax=Boletus edulis BED1 TaxID=1328754 RepID=A0AAD4GAV8_BOLED|nr:hypothetical protein EV363DRAFT_1207402 [Boletus edulis]KAF8433560.1 hypothetical protein L210DRAFT_3486213 [Boletus edulis BED1]